MKKFNIAIIGSGDVGTSTAKSLYDYFASTVFLNLLKTKQPPYEIAVHVINRDEAKARARVSDIASANLANGSVSIHTHGDERGLYAADVVIFTIGRSAGKSKATSRADNLLFNLHLIDRYAPIIQQHARNALVLIISNPVESMTKRMRLKTGLAYNRVLGLGLGVDQQRFCQQVSTKLALIGHSVAPNDISITAIGAHSAKGMMFIRSEMHINKEQIDQFAHNNNITSAEIDRILQACDQETRSAGINHVRDNHGQGAQFTPAAAAARLTQAYILNERLHTSAAVCQPDNICIGLPLTINGQDISIRPIALSASEQQQLSTVCEQIKQESEEIFKLHDDSLFVTAQTAPLVLSTSLGNTPPALKNARELFVDGYYWKSIPILNHSLVMLAHDPKFKLRIYLDLGMAYNAIGERELALRAYISASEYWKNIYATEYPAATALLIKVKDQISTEHEFIDEQLKIEKKISDEFSFDICRIFNNLANLCNKRDNQDLAIELYTMAKELAINDSHRGSVLYRAIAEGNLGATYSRLNDFKSAQKWHDHSFKLITKYFSDTPTTHYASAINNNGNLHYKKGEYQLALTAHKVALRVFMKCLTNTYQKEHQYFHPDYAIACYNLGVDFEKQGDINSAIRIYNVASNIFQRFKLQHYVDIVEKRAHAITLPSKL